MYCRTMSICIRIQSIMYASFYAFYAVADPGGNSGHGPIQLGYRLPPSNEEINMRYWETYQIGPLVECLDPPHDLASLAEYLDPPAACKLMYYTYSLSLSCWKRF